MFALHDCLTICNQRANQNAFLRRVFCRSRPLSSTPFHLMLSMDKQRVLSMLLHSCDVSHPAKRWQLHSQWTTRWEICLFVDIFCNWLLCINIWLILRYNLPNKFLSARMVVKFLFSKISSVTTRTVPQYVSQSITTVC